MKLNNKFTDYFIGSLTIIVWTIFCLYMSGYSMEREIREKLLTDKKITFYFQDSIYIDGEVKEIIKVEKIKEKRKDD